MQEPPTSCQPLPYNETWKLKSRSFYINVLGFIRFCWQFIFFPCILIKSIIFLGSFALCAFSAKVKYTQFFALQVKVTDRIWSNLHRCLLHFYSLCITKHQSYKLIVTKLLTLNHSVAKCPSLVKMVSDT